MKILEIRNEISRQKGTYLAIICDNGTQCNLHVEKGIINDYLSLVRDIPFTGLFLYFNNIEQYRGVFKEFEKLTDTHDFILQNIKTILLFK